MKKIIFTALLIVVASATAQAKVYLDESQKKALVFFLLPGERVSAAICQDVNESDFLALYEDTMRMKCFAISKAGVSREMVKTKVDLLNRQPTEKEKLQMSLAVGLIVALVGDSNGRSGLQMQMPGAYPDQIKIDLSGDQLFDQYLKDAKDQSIEKVAKTREFEGEIQIFHYLTRKLSE